jgi:hypothetical protein
MRMRTVSRAIGWWLPALHVGQPATPSNIDGDYGNNASDVFA